MKRAAFTMIPFPNILSILYIASMKEQFPVSDLLMRLLSIRPSIIGNVRPQQWLAHNIHWRQKSAYCSVLLLYRRNVHAAKAAQAETCKHVGPFLRHQDVWGHRRATRPSPLDTERRPAQSTHEAHAPGQSSWDQQVISNKGSWDE